MSLGNRKWYSESYCNKSISKARTKATSKHTPNLSERDNFHSESGVVGDRDDSLNNFEGVSELNKRKPSLSYVDSQSTLPALRDKLWETLKNSGLNSTALHYGIEFIIKILEGISWDITKDWDSCGVMIKRAENSRASVTGLDMLDVIPRPNATLKLSESPNPIYSDKHDPALLIILFNVFRRTMIHPNLQNSLNERTKKEYARYAPPEVGDLDGDSLGWDANRELMKLACVMDVALIAIPNHALSSVRITTLHFRGKANATLNTLASLLSPFGMEYSDLVYWLPRIFRRNLSSWLLSLQQNMQK